MSLLMRYLNNIHFVLFLFFSVIAQTCASDVTPRYQVKDGIAIYLGLLPAEMIEGHTAKSMHGGLPVGLYRYHVAVAVFDNKTGQRVESAKVQVRVSNRVGVGPDPFKDLEGMQMNGKFMYGNYFSLKTAGPYRIDVKVRVGNSVRPIQVTFDYDFAHT